METSCGDGGGGLSLCRCALSLQDVGRYTLAQRPIWRCEEHTQVVTDFFDELKSRSKGYASMEYKVTGYRVNDLVRLDIKVCRQLSTARIRVSMTHPHASCRPHGSEAWSQLG